MTPCRAALDLHPSVHSDGHSCVASRRATAAAAAATAADSSDEESDEDPADWEQEEIEVHPDDERALQAFMTPASAPQRTLADMIAEKLAAAGADNEDNAPAPLHAPPEERNIPGLDPKVSTLPV